MELLFIIEPKKKCKNNKKKDIFLCDSGGQYKYGTTDVTRTFVFQNQKKILKIFLQSFKRAYCCCLVQI